MTRRLQSGRFLIQALVLALCLLLAAFVAVEAAHGHLDSGEHCRLCLLTHAVAALPTLLVLPLLPCTLFRAGEAEARAVSLFRARVFRIRPPPCAC